MLIGSRSLLVALAAFLMLAQSALAQPPSWGGDRGSSSWGGYRGPGGDYRGGPPGSYSGWGGGPPSFGGFPGGGYSGGGFNPADMVRRADTNNNNTIEPDEFQNGWGRMVQRMAERAGMNTSQPVRVDALIAAVDPSRSSSSSSSGGSGATAANPQSFGLSTSVALVPGFDGAPGATTATGTTTSSSLTNSNLPLEKRFDERVLERAKERMKERDRNNNGVLDGQELADYRGDPPIMTSDLNKDNVISLEEMAMRYQARYGSSSGGPGGPGGFPFGMSGPGGPPGYPSSSYPSSSSSSSYRSSSSSSPTSSTPSSSSSTSSSSSSNDRMKEFAQSILARNDRNNSGKLEKDEWGGLRDGGEGTDTNKDGIITVDELAARMASRMSGGDRGPSGDRGPGGWSGGPPMFGGGPPMFGGGPPGGFDRGSFGDRGGSDRGSDRDRGSRDRGSDGGSRDRGSDGSRGSSYSSASSQGSSPQGLSSDTGPKTSYRVKTASELLPQGLDSWFTRSDTDGDGQVSMSEYAVKWDGDVAKKFQQLDANGDGFISANEALRSAPSSRR